MNIYELPNCETVNRCMELEIDDHEEEVLFEPTPKIAEQACKQFGCNLRRVLAENGFTYESICGRCGEPL